MKVLRSTHGRNYFACLEHWRGRRTGRENIRVLLRRLLMFLFEDGPDRIFEDVLKSFFEYVLESLLVRGETLTGRAAPDGSGTGVQPAESQSPCKDNDSDSVSLSSNSLASNSP